MDGLCSFRINVRKNWQLIIQESHQFSKTDFLLERVVGLPGGDITRFLLLSVWGWAGGRGEAVSAFVSASFLTQLQHQHPESVWMFYPPNASKHLQVHLESKNSVGAKSRESMTQTSYGIYIYIYIFRKIIWKIFRKIIWKIAKDKTLIHLLIS